MHSQDENDLKAIVDKTISHQTTIYKKMNKLMREAMEMQANQGIQGPSQEKEPLTLK